MSVVSQAANYAPGNYTGTGFCLYFAAGANQRLPTVSSNHLKTMWKEEQNSLHATFTFKDFAEAFAFMTEVALHAEKQNHHPNWSNVWNTVRFELNTHDAGNTVTDRDRKLAKTIDGIYQKFQ